MSAVGVIGLGLMGGALAERLRKQLPELRVAYMSGHDDQVLARHGVVDEGIWLLPKPFRDEELLAFVRGVLDAPAEKIRA